MSKEETTWIGKDLKSILEKLEAGIEVQRASPDEPVKGTKLAMIGKKWYDSFKEFVEGKSKVSNDWCSLHVLGGNDFVC
jgi:hypothetical protein